MTNSKLYCNNPQCFKEIKDNLLMYNNKEEEIYHIGDCALMAGALKAFKKGIMFNINVESIKREKALELLKNGELKQFGLEKKIDE